MSDVLLMSALKLSNPIQIFTDTLTDTRCNCSSVKLAGAHRVDKQMRRVFWALRPLLLSMNEGQNPDLIVL